MSSSNATTTTITATTTAAMNVSAAFPKEATTTQEVNQQPTSPPNLQSLVLDLLTEGILNATTSTTAPLSDAGLTKSFRPGEGDDSMTTTNESTMRISRLNSAIGMVFTLILLGYLARKLKYIPERAEYGIGQFVGKFAMPFAYGSGIAKINLATMNINILLTIVIAKLVLFIATAGFTLVLSAKWTIWGSNFWRLKKEDVEVEERKVVREEERKARVENGEEHPSHRSSIASTPRQQQSSPFVLSDNFIHGFAKAGIFGIFVTQANDVAFGVPIIDALYPPPPDGSSAPLSQYCYLSVAISLGVANVLGYILMEVSSAMEAARKRPPTLGNDDDDESPRSAAAALVNGGGGDGDDDVAEGIIIVDVGGNDDGGVVGDHHKTITNGGSTPTAAAAAAERAQQHYHKEEDGEGEEEEDDARMPPPPPSSSSPPPPNQVQSTKTKRMAWRSILHARALTHNNTTLRLVGDVTFAVVSNPSFVATVIGFIWAAASGGRGIAVNDYVNKTVTAAANTFNAMALFTIGYIAAGSLGSMNGKSFCTACLLSVTKVVLSPLVWYLTYLAIARVNGGGDDVGDEVGDVYANFLYVLGSFPTSPGVLGFSVLFNVQPNVISLAIVIGTAMSAPALYVYTALLGNLEEFHLMNVIYDTGAVCNILSMCLLTVLFLHALVLGVRVFPVPHAFIPLAITQLGFSVFNFACGFMPVFVADGIPLQDLTNAQLAEGGTLTYETPLGLRWASQQALLAYAALQSFGKTIQHLLLLNNSDGGDGGEWWSQGVLVDVHLTQQSVFAVSWIFERAITCWSLIAVHRLLQFIAAAEKEHGRLQTVEMACLNEEYNDERDDSDHQKQEKPPPLHQQRRLVSISDRTHVIAANDDNAERSDDGNASSSSSSKEEEKKKKPDGGDDDEEEDVPHRRSFEGMRRRLTSSFRKTTSAARAEERQQQQQHLRRLRSARSLATTWQLSKGMAPPSPLAYLTYVLLGWVLPVALLLIIVFASPPLELLPGMRCWIEYGYVQVVTGLVFNVVFVVLIIVGLFVVYAHRKAVSLLPRVIRVSLRRVQVKKGGGDDDHNDVSRIRPQTLIRRISSMTVMKTTTDHQGDDDDDDVTPPSTPFRHGTTTPLRRTSTPIRSSMSTGRLHQHHHMVSSSSSAVAAAAAKEHLRRAEGSASSHNRQFVSDTVTVLIVAFCQVVSLVLRATHFVTLLSYNFVGDDAKVTNATDAASFAVSRLIPLTEFYQAGSMQVMLFAVLFQNLLGFFTAVVCLTRTAVTEPWTRLCVSLVRRWTVATANAPVSRGVGEWWGGSITAIEHDYDDYIADVQSARSGRGDNSSSDREEN